MDSTGVLKSDLVGRRSDLFGMTGWGCAPEQDERCRLGIDRGEHVLGSENANLTASRGAASRNRERTADLETPCRLQQSLQVEIGTPSGRSLKDGPPPVGSGPQGGGLRYPAAALSCYPAVPNNSSAQQFP